MKIKMKREKLEEKLLKMLTKSGKKFKNHNKLPNIKHHLKNSLL